MEVSEKKMVPAVPAEQDDDGYDPMLAHYMNDIGLGADPTTGGYTFKEGNPKDVPCKFHDGFSGKCWKGDQCVYGHKLYTGGRFAKNCPDLAFAASISREVTPEYRLPVKPSLNNEREIICYITHVESPGEFYIRPTVEGTTCRCMKVDEIIKKKSDEERARAAAVVNNEDPMDNYFFGFSSLEIPECLGVDTHVPIFVPVTEEEKLNCYLNTAYNYKKLQCNLYFPGVELVAARVNNKWNRAKVQFYLENNETSLIRVQLLDTGEKVTLHVKDICRLPEKFCTTHAAVFHCALFRVSPIWFVWAKDAIKIFTDLVKGKKVRVIVKDDAGEKMGDVLTFEPKPYYVKILVDEKNNGVWTDVAQELINSGFGLEWCLMPYRPFGAKATDTKTLEFLHQPAPESLPPRALKVENKRLVWDVYDKKKLEGEEGSSSSSDCEEHDSWDIKSINVIGSIEKQKEESRTEKKNRISKWAQETNHFRPMKPFYEDPIPYTYTTTASADPSTVLQKTTPQTNESSPSTTTN